MSEVTSIAYNIGQDSAFLLEPVKGMTLSGYEMTETLSRYLVGNDFIEYLAYYRISEPNIIYTSRGMLTFERFWDSYLHGDNYDDSSFLNAIRQGKVSALLPITQNGQVTYFTYVCPLPQFSNNPQAFVIALIPIEVLEPVLASQLANKHGEISIYDAGGNLLHRVATLEDTIGLTPSAEKEAVGYYTSHERSRYAVEQTYSPSNGWRYISAVRLGDVVMDMAGTQIVLLFAVVAIMIVAVWMILISIISKYEPISELALTLSDQDAQSKGLIDEKSLITDTIATLKIDSEQKQKFESAYQEAAEASKAKSAFLSNMSHDIRTPMNAIVGMIAIAKKHIDEPAYVEDCLGKAEVASQYLLDIINNVLDMSRIESGKITLSEQKVELSKLIKEIVTIMHHNMEEKQQHFFVRAYHVKNEIFTADSVRLTQIFMNILSNAVKFTPPGGKITMSVTQNPPYEEAFGSYTFRFTDTGIGMSEQFAARVFDSFSREHETDSSKVEGTGLGMAIAKNLVDLMGGEITCESLLGVGTTFTVNIKFKTSDRQLTATQRECLDSCKGKTALVIGGGEEIFSGQRELLTDLGFNSFYADDLRDIPALPEGKTGAVLFNQIYGEPFDFEAAKGLFGGEKPPSAKYILINETFVQTGTQAAEKARIDAVLTEPLFISSLLEALSGAKSTEKASDAKGGALSLEGKRILLVEDNAMNREIAKKLLGETGVNITEALNGEEAVRIFGESGEGYFDCILMDLQMPIMDGYEATGLIRSMSRRDADKVIILAMTANTFDEDVRRVRDSGMNGHLGKPYSPEELYSTLARLLTAGKTT